MKENKVLWITFERQTFWKRNLVGHKTSVDKGRVIDYLKKQND